MRHAARQLGALALLAMLVRAIIPAGYMVASAESPDSRYMVVQLCDSHSGFSQIIDLDTGKQIDASKLPAKSADKSSKAPCVFATAAHLSAPEAFVTLVAPVAPPQTVGFAKSSVTPGRGIAAPPPPSTGPPSLV